MRQEPSNRIRKTAYPDALTQHPVASQDGRSGSKSRSSPAAGQSLTAKMLEYRSWWNLPRTKPGKAHP